MADTTRNEVLNRLRSLVAWYEWQHRPNMHAVDALEGAASLLQCDDIDVLDAVCVVNAWRPLHIPDPPTSPVDDGEALERSVLMQMSDAVERAENTEQRVHFKALLREQHQTFETSRRAARCA
jgi:hypothetical protein